MPRYTGSEIRGALGTFAHITNTNTNTELRNLQDATNHAALSAETGTPINQPLPTGNKSFWRLKGDRNLFVIVYLNSDFLVHARLRI
jgi:hypothetical protein